MKIKVKLFSVLTAYAPDYDPVSGLELDLAAGARVSDLIRQLKIPDDKAPVVSCDGRVLKINDFLSDGSVVHLFQPVAGG